MFSEWINEWDNEWMQLSEKLCLNRFLTDKQFRHFFKFLNSNFLTLVLMFLFKFFSLDFTTTKNSPPLSHLLTLSLFLFLSCLFFNHSLFYLSLSFKKSSFLYLSLLSSSNLNFPKFHSCFITTLSFTFSYISPSFSLPLSFFFFWVSIFLSLIRVFPVKLTFLRTSHVR
jgi:hypothetical protein